MFDVVSGDTSTIEDFYLFIYFYILEDFYFEAPTNGDST